jgi:hypothetical protein
MFQKKAANKTKIKKRFSKELKEEKKPKKRY